MSSFIELLKNSFVDSMVYKANPESSFKRFKIIGGSGPI